MLYPDNGKEKKEIRNKIKNKKGVSVIIGYVILVSFVIVLAIIVYQWIKTYVPMEELNCPDGVSLFVDKYACSEDQLTLYLKNNGRFNVGGYFIYATTSPSQLIATTDLSRKITDETAKIYPTGIKLVSLTSGNLFEPNEKETEVFDLTNLNRIYSIEITPFRWQVEKNKNRLVSCKDARIRESLDCGGVCVDEAIEETCAGRVCGTTANNCNHLVTCLPDDCGTDVCNDAGQCVPPEQCTDTCLYTLWECGSVCGGRDLCGINHDGLCPIVNHASSICVDRACIYTCDSGWCVDSSGEITDGCNSQLGTISDCAFCGDVCFSSWKCLSSACSSCNGTWTGTLETEDVECDGTPQPAHCLANCTCTDGYVSDGLGGCKIPDSVKTCGDYCVWLPTPVYIGGTCRQSAAQCTKNEEVHESGGDILPYCDPDNEVGDTCCCKPPA